MVISRTNKYLKEPMLALTQILEVNHSLKIRLLHRRAKKARKRTKKSLKKHLRAEMKSKKKMTKINERYT